MIHIDPKFKKVLKKMLRSSGRLKDRPYVAYNKTGDILTACLSRSKSYYCEWIFPYMELMRDQNTKEIIGVKIWGAKEVIDSKEKMKFGKTEAEKKRRKGR